MIKLGVLAGLIFKGMLDLCVHMLNVSMATRLIADWRPKLYFELDILGKLFADIFSLTNLRKCYPQIWRWDM